MAKMPGTRYADFNTEAEARAFAVGVEFVNDSALQVRRILRLTTPVTERNFYRVELTDLDDSEADANATPEPLNIDTNHIPVEEGPHG